MEAPRTVNFGAKVQPQRQITMPITFEESDELFAKCDEYEEIMLVTQNRNEFDEAKSKLVELTGNLRSSSGEFTPSLGHSPKDKTEAQGYLQRVNERKKRAERLWLWAAKNQFEEPS